MGQARMGLQAQAAVSQLHGVLRKSDFWRGESWREEMVCGAEWLDEKDLLHTPYM